MKCSKCGQDVAEGTGFCPGCGAKIAPKSDLQTVMATKTVNTALVPKRTFEYIVLCLIGGAFGLHHLYLGHKDKAMKFFWISVGGAFLCLGIPTWICWLLSLIDLMKADKVLDAQGNPLA